MTLNGQRLRIAKVAWKVAKQEWKVAKNATAWRYASVVIATVVVLLLTPTWTSATRCARRATSTCLAVNLPNSPMMVHWGVFIYIIKLSNYVKNINNKKVDK